MPLQSRRRRDRRRVWWRAIKWGFALGILGAVAIYAYQTGVSREAAKVSRLEQEIIKQSGQIDSLEQTNIDLSTSLKDARGKVADWQKAYERDVPKGDMKALYGRVRERLDDGIAADRLRFVIDQVSNERDCSNVVVTKRFIVETPVYKGPNQSVGLAQRTISVTALGESAIGQSGTPEAWYDRTKPVTARFTHIGGEATEAKGKLPLQHSMVIGDTEHRFVLNMGETRSFVTVTHTTCRYP